MISMRAMGYSFESAVADIIDNSISACANEIKIYSDPLESEPYFCILDNGCGMNKEVLDAEMFNPKKDKSVELEMYDNGQKFTVFYQPGDKIMIIQNN